MLELIPGSDQGPPAQGREEGATATIKYSGGLIPRGASGPVRCREERAASTTTILRTLGANI